MSDSVRQLNENSYEIIEKDKGYVKKYANGLFEAYVRTNVPNSEFNFIQIGNSGIYYAAFTNLGFGIKAKRIYSISCNVYNSGVIWCGDAYESSTMDAIGGMVMQYGNDKTRTTHFYVKVEGTWK